MELLLIIHVLALVLCNVKKPAAGEKSKFAKAYPYIRYVAGLWTDKVNK